VPVIAHATCSTCSAACLPSPTGRCRACRGLATLRADEPLEIPGSPLPKRPATPQRPSAPSPAPAGVRQYRKGENVLTPRPAEVVVSAPRCKGCRAPLPLRAPGTAGRPASYCPTCKQVIRNARPRDRGRPAPQRPATIVCRICLKEFPANANGRLRVICKERACWLKNHAQRELARRKRAPAVEVPASSAAAVAPVVVPEDWINLVWWVAHKTARKWGVEPGELAGAGFEGLVQAARTFDPSRGFKFPTYAKKRIFGAIVDEYRRENGGRRLRREGHPSTVKLSALADGDGKAFEPAAPATEGDPLEVEESLARLRVALEELDPRTRAALLVDVSKFQGQSRNRAGETLAQAARRFGISESRMCQIRRVGMEELHEKLAQPPDPRRPLLARLARALEAGVEVKKAENNARREREGRELQARTVTLDADVHEAIRRAFPGVDLDEAVRALILKATGELDEPKPAPPPPSSILARLERLESLVLGSAPTARRVLEVDEEEALLDGRPVRLTPLEHDLLRRFVESDWVTLEGDRYVAWKRVSRLRTALEAAGLRHAVENRRGRYRLDPALVEARVSSARRST
jgi:RNA polymerase sigma factor (sigma-70 family)